MERKRRLLAEIEYQTQFKPGYATSTNNYESGLVAGAKVVRRFWLPRPEGSTATAACSFVPLASRHRRAPRYLTTAD